MLQILRQQLDGRASPAFDALQIVEVTSAQLTEMDGVRAHPQDRTDRREDQLGGKQLVHQAGRRRPHSARRRAAPSTLSPPRPDLPLRTLEPLTAVKAL
ncbi:hypothetical protein NCC78_00055 [Micromonospora phytophila]|uniref:hypothetical protein n=1 Tax=Micromonospora phytophila TaxID=709888 RepID=UPI00202F5732|nr:hypothetical protein [Micromonospora phytophila]MCM0673133.1 hypothetical protein [Micromonospora phytophila]